MSRIILDADHLDADQVDGTRCVVCRADLTIDGAVSSVPVGTVPVGTVAGGQVFACTLHVAAPVQPSVTGAYPGGEPGTARDAANLAERPAPGWYAPPADGEAGR